jgi:mono/diheme cytochrome c family protein
MFLSKRIAQGITVLGLGNLILTGTPASAQTVMATNVPTYLHDVQPLFLGKCSRCHNEDSTYLPNWSSYQSAFVHRAEIRRRVWDAWKGHYFKQAMPAGNCPELRTITEDDRKLIRDWVDAGALLGVVNAGGPAQNKAQRIQYGKRLFDTMCATCHQPVGQGLANKYPPLAHSDFLNADKNQAIRVLLHGRQGEIVVNGVTYNNTMPAFPLGDEDIANALTYTYNSFGNSGKEVTPDEVKTLRAEKYTPPAPVKTAPSQFE